MNSYAAPDELRDKDRVEREHQRRFLNKRPRWQQLEDWQGLSDALALVECIIARSIARGDPDTANEAERIKECLTQIVRSEPQCGRYWRLKRGLSPEQVLALKQRLRRKLEVTA
jgi:hypothetical protein